MSPIPDLEHLWFRRRRDFFSLAFVLSNDGITLGAGTMLLRAVDDEGMPPDEMARTNCLLAVARGRTPDPDIVIRLRKALRSWQTGDKGMAQIRVAQAGLCSLRDEGDAWRLFLADLLLEAGMRPDDLSRELSRNAFPLAKDYDENEPRNPEGTGRKAGRWTKTSASAVDPIRDSRHALLPVAAVGLLEDLGPSSLEWLAAAASRMTGPFAFFGAMVIPAPNPGVADEGVLPGHADIAYRIDHDTGTLRLSSKGDQDPEDAIVGVLGHVGLYRQIETGTAIGRVLPNGSVIVDLGNEATENPEPDTEPAGSGGRTPTGYPPPKLCPAPGPDAGRHYGFSAMYELYVRDHVNPQRIPQLPVGLTFALPSDAKRGWTYYDDCQESTGTMIEAKSDESGFMLSDRGSKIVKKRYLEQARDQVRAAQGRSVEWYFHWKKAALIAQSLFKDNGFPIKVHYLPFYGRDTK